MMNFRSLSKLVLAVSFFLITTCFAEEDPRLRIHPQQGVMYFRGVDETTSPLFIEDGRASEAINVQFTSTNGLVKRSGYSLVNDTLDIQDVDFQAVTGLYYTKLSSGTEYVLAVCGDRLYYDNSGVWTRIYRSVDDGAEAITYDADSRFKFITANDQIIFTNNSNTVYKWTGSGGFKPLDVSDLSDALTTAKDIFWFRNYLILANTTEATVARKTRFRWSDVGTTETWQDDNFIDIDALGGQEINGMAELGGSIYIFLTDSIYKVSLVGGDEVFTVTKVVDGTGCIARDSIQNVYLANSQQGIIFLSKDKTVNFYDGVNLVNASFLIGDTMAGLASTRLQYAASAEDGDDYYLSVSESGQTTNNIILDLSLDTGNWSQHTQIDSNAMAKVVDSDSDIQIYSGNYDSFVYQLFTEDLTSDIDGFTGTFASNESVMFTNTASSLTVLYDDTQNFTCTGAIVRITSGTGADEEKVIIACDRSHIVVDSAFTDVPDDTSQYSIGDIAAKYTTKWYDCGDPTRRKDYGEIYLWTEEQTGSQLGVSYAIDFGGDLSTQSISLEGDAAVWGTAVWGTDLWGGKEALFNVIKLKSSGRFLRLKFENDDIDETFNIYGWALLYWAGDIQ